jgi:ABC-type dipeptide/oligopeptide/nickel transport system ATPase component
VGQVQAVDGVSLDIENGRRSAWSGSRGAGRPRSDGRS